MKLLVKMSLQPRWGGGGGGGGVYSCFYGMGIMICSVNVVKYFRQLEWLSIVYFCPMIAFTYLFNVTSRKRGQFLSGPPAVANMFSLLYVTFRNY